MEKIKNKLLKVDYFKYFNALNDHFVFSFNSQVFLTQTTQPYIITLTSHLLHLIYLRIDQSSLQVYPPLTLQEQIVSKCLQIKQKYYDLFQVLVQRKRTKHIEQILFVIVLVISSIIQDQIQQSEGTDENQKSQSTQQPQLKMEQEIYIILIYQTLGKLVSPKAFDTLKRSLIKKEIVSFEESKRNMLILKSLKNIKEMLVKNDNLGKSRQQKRKQTYPNSEERPIAVFKKQLNSIFEINDSNFIKKPSLVNLNPIKTNVAIYPQGQSLVKRVKQSYRRKFDVNKKSSSVQIWSMAKDQHSTKQKKTMFFEKQNLKPRKQQEKTLIEKVKFQKLGDCLKKKNQEKIDWEKKFKHLKHRTTLEFKPIPMKSSINRKIDCRFSQRNIRNDVLDPIRTYREGTNLMPKIVEKKSLCLEDDRIDRSKVIKLDEQVFLKRLMRERAMKKPEQPLDTYNLRKDWKKFQKKCKRRQSVLQQFDKYYRI